MEHSHQAMVVRSRLEDIGSSLTTQKVTVLTGAAGYGKSHLIRRWEGTAPIVSVAFRRVDRALPMALGRLLDALRIRVPGVREVVGPAATVAPPEASGGDRIEMYGAQIGSELDRHRTKPLVLAFDDLDEIAGSDASLLLDSLLRHTGPQVSFVLASRHGPPVRLARMRTAGLVVELRATDLAFTRSETEELAGAIGVTDAVVIENVHNLTGGWPVATRLALEALRSGSDPVADRRPEHLFEFLAEEVIAAETQEDQALLAGLAVLGRFTPGLARAVGLEIDPIRLAYLDARGVYFARDGTEYVVAPMVRWFLQSRHFTGGEPALEIFARSVDVFLERRFPERAIDAALTSGDASLITHALRHGGLELIEGSATDQVLEALDMLGPDVAPDLLRLRGLADLYSGSWDAALLTFERIAAGLEHLDAALAAEMLYILYQRGQLEAAHEIFERALPAMGGIGDQVRMYGWAAAVAWVGGDLAEAQKLSDEALRLASQSGDDRALANALNVQAMVAAVRGDRAANEAFYVRALRHAERAGDVLATLRIHVNRGSRQMEEGAYADSIAATEVALELAQQGGFGSFRAMALSNRGEALTAMGRFDEAASDFAEARTIWEKRGSAQVAYALQGMGWVHLHRGDFALATSSFEHARQLAADSGDTQGLVPALCGLARTVALTDPPAAIAHARAAVAVGPNLRAASAYVALAAALIADGDHEGGAEAASTALQVAAERGQRYVVADALEWLALAEPDGWRRFDEALQIWEELEVPFPLLRCRIRLAQARGARRFDITAMIDEGRRIGSRPLVAAGERLLDDLGPSGDRSAIEVRVLGGFIVERDGTPVAAGGWQSKKARDLLKLLVARRGLPVGRDQLQEALWPGDDPAKTANRLSVALSTLRAVFDPGKHHDADHYLAADRGSVALRLDRIDVDLEHFHDAAGAGFVAASAGDRPRATELLQRAEGLYGGDAFDEDLGAVWPIAAGEQARSTYIDLARWLADDAAALDDWDGASRYLLRILERDQYDERAHLALIRAMISARRHGEAQRLYRLYCQRMEDLGVEPMSFPHH